jgi:hypothetical protein
MKYYKMVLITQSNMYRIKSADRPELDDLAKLVGGHITQTTGTWAGKEVWILVDEEGEHKDLPINFMASSCAYQELLGDALILVNFELE